MKSASKSANKKLLWLLLALEVVPILVPVMLVAFGTVAIFFLLLGQFKPIIIWPLGLLAAVVASAVIVRHYPKDKLENKSRQACNVLVILGVLLWGSFNILYTSQHVLVNRDPALYANAGIWLIKHDSLKIPTVHTFGNIPGVMLSNGSGFKTAQASDQKYVYAQGLHLLPAFIGLAGRMVGVAKALHVNVLFGMSALLGIYAFGRELVRRTWWAAVATGAVSASMPLINMSRDSYSEPLAATFTFGGLALIWLALKSKKLSIWFLAGLVIGAGTLTRIDGYLTVAEITAFLVVVLSLAATKERTQTLKQVASALAGMSVTSILGWLDVSKLSIPYFDDLHSQFNQEVLAIIGILVLGAVVVRVAWRTSLLTTLDKATKAWRAEVGAIAVLAFTVFLVSRPLWYRPVYIGGVDAGDRTYAELTTQWVSWYIGPVLATLGVAGIAASVMYALREKRMLLTAGLLVVIGTSLLYLVKPNIAPDQIWASRRMIPVILPGVAVFGAVALDWLYGQYLEHTVKWKYVVAGLASIMIFLTPLLTSKPLLKLRPFAELGGVNEMCAILPKDAAILWLGDEASQRIVQPTRDICGVPSQGFIPNKGGIISNHTLADLARNARDNHKVPIIGIYGSGTSLLPYSVSSKLKPVSTISIQQLEHTFVGPPEATTTSILSIKLGVVQDDGSITALGRSR